MASTGGQGHGMGTKVTLARLCQGFLTWNKRLEVSVISVSWRNKHFEVSVILVSRRRLTVNQIKRAQKIGQQQKVLKL